MPSNSQACPEVQPAERARDDRHRGHAREVGKQAALSLDSLWPLCSGWQPNPESGIDVVDMFSGCGGMSAGFRALNACGASYRMLGAIDIDEIANETYRTNFGVTPWKADVKALARQPAKIDRWLEQSERNPDHPLVLIGCAPCQGFSSHRNAAGASDERNSLFGCFARIAVRLNPDAVVIENVPELLTTRYWRNVADARKRLERAGYYTHLHIYNMAAFGVPQERFRAVFLALKRPFAAPSGFLDRPDFRTVRDAIAGLPPVRPGERIESDPLHYSATHRADTVATIRAVPKNGGRRPEHVGPECLRRAKEKQGRGAYDDVYGRLWWDRPSITITSYARNPASGRYAHPEQDRGLTIREAALLQGFPETYQFAGSLDQCFRQIGNAVPPRFAAYLAGFLEGEILQRSEPCVPFEPGVTEPVGSSFSRLIAWLKQQ